MKQFFPMGRSEARLLVFLYGMAVIAFLPVWRNVEIGGMVLFGWLLAAMMIVSPALALLVIGRADRTAGGKVRHPKTKTGFEQTEGESRSPGPEEDPED
jgi:hypothetical protein